MKKILHVFLLLYWYIAASHVQALIVTIDDIEIIRQFIDKKNPESHLVAFDIDDTIAIFAQSAGNNRWLEFTAKLYQEEELNFEVAWKKIQPWYVELQFSLWLDPSQETTPLLINDLQNDGIQCIGLTLRSEPIVDRTLEQLAKININFMKNSIFAPDQVILATKPECLYKNGIIFCGQNKKGHMLAAFLDHVDHAPKKVIFIDDKIRHVIDVEESMLARGIECVSIHYTRFNPKGHNLPKY